MMWTWPPLWQKSAPIAQELARREVESWCYEPPPEESGPGAPTDKMQLGNHAKRLLDDPVMKLAFEGVTTDLMKTWRETAHSETEKREDAYRMLRLLDGVEHKLRLFARNVTVVAADERRREAEEARSRVESKMPLYREAARR